MRRRPCVASTSQLHYDLVHANSEAKAAADNGIEYHELMIATDGLAVMVHPENNFATCLTTQELKRIWEVGSSVMFWQHVRPEWPNQPLHGYGPGIESGTYDYFTETIVGQLRASRYDYFHSEDDNELVHGVASDPFSLGYFGLAYYVENPDKLKLVAIDSGQGCVLPTPENIKAGKYTPLLRPPYIYVNKKSLERPEVKAYVEFYMDNAANLAAKVWIHTTVRPGVQGQPGKNPVGLTCERSSLHDWSLSITSHFAYAQRCRRMGI